MDKQKFDYGEFHWGKGGFAALLLDFAVLFRQCDHQRTASHSKCQLKRSNRPRNMASSAAVWALSTFVK